MALPSGPAAGCAPVQTPWPRRLTRQVTVGGVPLGGGAPVSVQAMTKTDTRDVAATAAQAQALAEAGAEIVRIAVPDEEAAAAFGRVRRLVAVPLVADIHFDYRLAIEAARQGADKLRLNPGNIGDDERLGQVVAAARERGIPLRAGVNAGSLEPDLRQAHGGPTPAALAESAVRTVARLERLGADDIVVSIKAADVPTTVAATRALVERSDRPLHLGITEAGFGEEAVIASTAGLAILLAEGIGDTLRVSLTDDPCREVEVGLRVLRALELRRGPRLISCPACGRCRVALRPIAEQVLAGMATLRTPLRVAVMGCEVNGPGEAREADVGLAAGKGKAVLFARGRKLRTVPIEEAAEALLAEARRMDEGEATEPHPRPLS